MGENQVKIGHILMAHCNPAHASLAIVFADIFPEKGFSINLEHVARKPAIIIEMPDRKPARRQIMRQPCGKLEPYIIISFFAWITISYYITEKHGKINYGSTGILYSSYWLPEGAQRTFAWQAKRASRKWTAALERTKLTSTKLTI